MTPTPNPSPELRALVQAFLISLTGGGRNAVNTLSINHDGLAKLVKDAERSLSQTPPAPPLSTDVQSAATGFHEQDVSLKVTLPAPGEVKLREAYRVGFNDGADEDFNPDGFIARTKAASLATVAAANDEGVAEAYEAAAQIADAYSRGPHAQRWHGENIAAAIRLLSQGGGRA